MRLRKVRDWHLRSKLLFLLLAASVVPLLVSTLLEFRSASRIIRRSAQDLLGARADQRAGELDAFHLTFSRSVDRLASTPLVTEFCESGPAARISRPASAWRKR